MENNKQLQVSEIEILKFCFNWFCKIRGTRTGNV